MGGRHWGSGKGRWWRVYAFTIWHGQNHDETAVTELHCGNRKQRTLPLRKCYQKDTGDGSLQVYLQRGFEQQPKWWRAHPPASPVFIVFSLDDMCHTLGLWLLCSNVMKAMSNNLKLEILFPKTTPSTARIIWRWLRRRPATAECNTFLFRGRIQSKLERLSRKPFLFLLVHVSVNYFYAFFMQYTAQVKKISNMPKIRKSLVILMNLGRSLL